LNHRPRVPATRQGLQQRSVPCADWAIPQCCNAAAPIPGRAGQRLRNPPRAGTAMEDPLAASWQGPPPPITARLSGWRCECMAEARYGRSAGRGLRTHRTRESGHLRHNFQPAALPPGRPASRNGLNRPGSNPQHALQTPLHHRRHDPSRMAQMRRKITGITCKSVRCRPPCDRQASRPVAPQLADMCRGSIRRSTSSAVTRLLAWRRPPCRTSSGVWPHDGQYVPG
jgi:hypothetical protein